MSKTCRTCSAAATIEARFCRLCGTPFEVSNETGKSSTTLAATSSLTSHTRPTDQLDAADTSRSLPSTSPVVPTETNDLRPGLHTNESLSADITLRQRAADLERELSATDINRTTALNAVPSGQVHDSEVTLPRIDRSRNFVTTTLHAADAGVASSATAVTPSGAPAVGAGASARHKANRFWFVLAVLLFGATAGGVWWWLVVTKPSSTVAGNKQQLARERLVEAEGLLASGKASDAVIRIREAISFDNSNAEAHRLLGNALLQQGQHRQAIEEYHVATQLDPNDVAAWSALAGAQSAEGAYKEAIESYQRLTFAARSEADISDQVRLAYADALRLAGRTADAQTIYQGLANSASPDVAGAAKRFLVAPTIPAPGANANVTKANTMVAPAKHPEASAPQAAPSTLPVPTVAAGMAESPTEPRRTITGPVSNHYARGVQLWSTNRAAALAEMRLAAKGNADANYYLGLHTVEGRNIQSLQRAELLDALLNFQKAQKGRFSRQAREYVDRLGKEYDRRRGQ